MSRSSGAGSPVYFACSRARLGNYMDLRRFHGHDVVRTGRSRAHHPGRYHALGSRSLTTRYEYRCSCGHVGWTNHMDILKVPIESARA